MRKEISVRQARYPSFITIRSTDSNAGAGRLLATGRPKRDKVATAHTCPAKAGYQAIIESKMSFTKLYHTLPDAFEHLMSWPSFQRFSAQQ